MQDIGEMWARVARSSAAPHLKRGLLTTKTTSLLQLMPVDDTLLTNWPPLDPPLLPSHRSATFPRLPSLSMSCVAPLEREELTLGP